MKICVVASVDSICDRYSADRGVSFATPFFKQRIKERNRRRRLVMPGSISRRLERISLDYTHYVGRTQHARAPDHVIKRSSVKCVAERRLSERERRKKERGRERREKERAASIYTQAGRRRRMPSGRPSYASLVEDCEEREEREGRALDATIRWREVLRPVSA